MIQVRDLRKTYSQSSILKNVSFRLDNKETLVILGPSGSGKTTLLRLLAGFETPDGGIIEIDSKTMSSTSVHKAPKFRNLTMIFQDLALWPHMTVFENVDFVLQNSGYIKSERVDRVNELLAQVSLSEKSSRYPHQLSGGEKQRLAIARAIVPLPRHILMDEPFNNLDTFLKKEMIDLTLELIDKMNISILYVTHNFDEVLSLADRVAVMSQGVLGESLDGTDLKQITESELVEWYTQCLTSCTN